MARKKFPDLAEDFAESVPAPVDTPQVRPENESTYISRAVASQIENSRQDKVIENRNLELGMSQGRKGLKLKRMTMAFSDMNYDFMRTYARQKGISATQLVNDLLSELRKAVYKY
ncbi:MAG: hypothetical protein IJ859_09680 [Synergistaceae bacterium]|nr:hypothetical protein [Synergistaceae bacterium]